MGFPELRTGCSNSMNIKFIPFASAARPDFTRFSIPHTMTWQIFLRKLTGKFDFDPKIEFNDRLSRIVHHGVVCDSEHLYPWILYV